MPGQVEEEKKADSAFVSRSGRSTKTVDYKERSDRMIGQSVAVKEDMTEQCELDALKALQPEAKAFRYFSKHLCGVLTLKTYVH